MADTTLTEHLKHAAYKFINGFKNFLSFIGPGYLIAVGYMDPGNWATDLAAGSQFGYALLTVILFSNIVACLLQSIAVKLGVVSGMDLARMCREHMHPYVNWILYVLCELAIIATDLAEVIGSAVALDLLFGLPLAAGVCITGLDVLLLLLIYRPHGSLRGVRIFEGMIIAMVTTVGVCFALELAYVDASISDVLRGFIPDKRLFTETERIYLAMGIVGATVMPHNLYLHSYIVQARAFLPLPTEAKSVSQPNGSLDRSVSSHWWKRLFSRRSDDAPEAQSALYDTSRQQRSSSPTRSRRRRTGYDTPKAIASVLRLTILDCILALTIALFVNAAILIVGAAAFHDLPIDPNHPENNGDPADLFDAHRLLGHYLGSGAALVYAIALLVAGQSSTLTATLTGQIIMEGFLGLRIRPWIRRLVTRLCAIVPALVMALVGGRSGVTNLLVASQVALSVQLPFAIIPLVWFTSFKKYMRPVALQDRASDRDALDHTSVSSPNTGALLASPRLSQYEEELVAEQHTVQSPLQPRLERQESTSSATSHLSLPIPTSDPEYIPITSTDIHFANAPVIAVLGGVIALLLIGLNLYMLVGIAAP